MSSPGDDPESGRQAPPRSRFFLIAEPQTLFRRGLGLLLRQWYPAAAVLDVPDIAGCASAAARPAPDLILASAGLAAPGEFAGLAGLLRQFPASPVLLLAEERDPRLAMAALRHGARGYLPKAAGEDHLRHVLALLLSGEIYAPADCLLEQRRSPPACRPLDAAGPRPGQQGLTRREQEVLIQLSRGLSNKEIGLKLSMAESTVKVHVKAILRKLRAANRTQAAMRAAMRSAEADHLAPPTDSSSGRAAETIDAWAMPGRQKK